MVERVLINKIFGLICENKVMSVSEIVARVKYSRRIVLVKLHKLKKSGYIVKNGESWEVSNTM
jgi:predicted transcriptional regulator